MENKLKTVTAEVIKTLHACDVDTIMATGDNVLTAISVARQTGILKKNSTIWIGDLGRRGIVWKRHDENLDHSSNNDIELSEAGTS